MLYIAQASTGALAMLPPPRFHPVLCGLAGALLALAAVHAGARLAAAGAGFTLLRLTLCHQCLIGE